MDELQIIFISHGAEMSPITIKLNELEPTDVRKYPYAGDFFSGLIYLPKNTVSNETTRYNIELTGNLQSLITDIPNSIFYKFTVEYDKWLARRRQYILSFGEFFDMNIGHLDEMRAYYSKWNDQTKLMFLTLADRIGQDLFLHMLARLFAEDLRGLSRQEIAKKLNITPELTPDEAQQVKYAIFNGEEIPSSFFEA